MPRLFRFVRHGASLRIAGVLAWRYLFLRASRGGRFTRRLTFFSMLMVAVGVAALIIALSAFNGIENLLRKDYAALDPALSLVPLTKRSMVIPASLIEVLESSPEVASFSPIKEDYALASFQGRQHVVVLRGMQMDFLAESTFMDYVIGGVSGAIIGLGVQQRLKLSWLDPLSARLQLFYPTTQLGFNARSLYRNKEIPVTGVFELGRPPDIDHVLLPLASMQNLMGDSTRFNSVALRLAEGYASQHPEAVSKQLLARVQALDPEKPVPYRILTREAQRGTLYKILRIEKIAVVFVFSFILFVASLGVFFVSFMLLLEKKHDLALLSALGSGRALLGSIFVFEGFLVSGLGTLGGLVLGIGLCVAQQQSGFLKMTSDPHALPYPMVLDMADIPVLLLSVGLLTLSAVGRPAWLASRVNAASHR